MLSLLTITLLMCIGSICLGGFSLSIITGVTSDIPRYNQYQYQLRKLTEDNKRIREYEKLKIGLSQDLLINNNIPEYVMELKDWAIKEIANLPPKDKSALIQAAKVAKAGQVIGVSMRLAQSGRSYDYATWQALCTFCNTVDVTKKEPMKPAEVDQFDEPRLE